MKNIEIYNLAEKYLCEFDVIDQKMISKHLSSYKSHIPPSFDGVYKRLLESLKNRQGMPNYIGNIDNYAKELCSFSPQEVLETYSDKWELLFDKIEKSGKSPGKMSRGPRSSWAVFCKGALSGAKFLSSFKNIREYRKFIETFYNGSNPYLRLSLPMLLEREIFGFGFALACDFLKESGYPGFPKPDVHIMDIFKGVGISSENANAYEVFKDVIIFSESINKEPYEVDKLFWLIGSGNFYLDSVKINTKRKDFIKLVKGQAKCS